MQQNRIENWVLDTVSKNIVIFAFYDKNKHNFFDSLCCDKKMLQNQLPGISKSVYLIKRKVLLLLMRQNEKVKICVYFAVEYISHKINRCVCTLL